MEPIKLTGSQIVDTKKMKQSGRYRITLELTEEDTKINGGSLAVAEINDLIANVELTFTEIQGNNNGHEKSLLRNPAKPKEESIYKRFKRICVEYSGEEYYTRLKKYLGVGHLKDFEKDHSFSMVEDILKIQERFIVARMNKEQNWTPLIDITHKDNAFKLWKKLFDDFNNPKK